MEKKICSKCKIEYTVDNFHLRTPNGSYRSHCNFCLREYRNNRYKINNEKEKLNNKIYHQANREVILEKKKIFYEKNKHKEYYNHKKYREENPEKIKLIRKKYEEKNKKNILIKKKEWREKNPTYFSDRKKIDPIFKLSCNMRTRIGIFIKKSSKINKNNKTFNYIGCSREQLKEYIEKQFKDGMSWDNYGLYGWHIDHIIPLSSAKTEDDVYKLCHYTNLQPLWAKDNISKGDRI